MADGPIFRATAEAIDAATELGPLDGGAVAVLLELARQIDALAANGGVRGSGSDAKLDTVSIPTYLRFCSELGLTPAGRVKLGAKEKPPAGKLAAIRADVRRAS